MKISSLLGLSSEALLAIRTSGKPADTVLEHFFRSRKYLGARDRRFIAESVYGTLRHFRKFEAILETVSPGYSSRLSDEVVSLLLVLQHLATPEAASIGTPFSLDELNLSKELHPLAALLLNSHLRISTPANDSIVRRLALEYSFPDWMVESVLDRLTPSEAENALKALNTPAPLTLRVNTLKTSVDECLSRLESEGEGTERCALSPVGLRLKRRVNAFRLQSFREGLFEMQDEGSQMLGLIVDPKPSSRVLDACAGAGGKTLLFSAIMKNRGEVLAADLHSYRLDELRRRARRAGVHNIRVHIVDALQGYDTDTIGLFDVVFVDAPCSGLGTIRRNPGMKWSVTPDSVKELSDKQSYILSSCTKAVKPGGRLVYATCTFTREENETVVERFLQRHKDFMLTHPAESLARFGAQNALHGSYIQFMPHLHDTDWFFCAVLRKDASSI